MPASNPSVHVRLFALSGFAPSSTVVARRLVRLICSRSIYVARRDGRAHFLAVAAQTMRRILVDFARHRDRQKRGGDIQLVTLDEARDVGQEKGADLVALDEALTALAAVDARMSQVVELRFFGGLTVEETADVLHVSAETVMRDWKTAKAWLLRELSDG
jgi:RNA polymerase sigma factor (TIGR02999 family)